MPLSSLGFDLDRAEREPWAGAPRQGAPLLFTLSGVSFLLVGLYITVAPQFVSRAPYQGMAWPGMRLPPAFGMIPGAAQVYDTTRKPQEQAGQVTA